MQALGYLNNGVPLTTSASGVADGSFSDPLVSLSGVDSLIGRSIAIHQNTTMASPIIGHCVIGRSMQNAALADTISPSSAASCRFSATTAGVNAFNLASPSGIDGHLTFTQSDPSQPLAASMSVFGLGVGSHPFHVHVGGDLIDSDDALSVLGHFAGSVAGSTPMRPSCPAANQNEVGALNNCVAISTSGAVSTTAFYDSFASLSGLNNIIGRSIVIHLSAANATRVAQCVIGRTADGVSNPPAATSAALSTWLTWVIGIAIGLFVGAVAMAFVCRRRVALANSSADIAMSVGNYEHHTDTV
jgi:Cu/Zn superoxide dismutase